MSAGYSLNWPMTYIILLSTFNRAIERFADRVSAHCGVTRDAYDLFGGSGATGPRNIYRFRHIWPSGFYLTLYKRLSVCQS